MTSKAWCGIRILMWNSHENYVSGDFRLSGELCFQWGVCAKHALAHKLIDCWRILDVLVPRRMQFTLLFRHPINTQNKFRNHDIKKLHWHDHCNACSVFLTMFCLRCFHGLICFPCCCCAKGDVIAFGWGKCCIHMV